MQTMKRLSFMLACLSLLSCGQVPPLSDVRRVETSEQVANVFVAAYPAVPWTTISEKLEPKHNLSTTDARALAAVTTQSQVSQFLSTFAAGLAIGLPARTSTSVTTLAADGTTTTTGSKNVGPGTVPSSNGATAIALTDAALIPDLTKNPFANGIDASTQLMAGTGVYQLGQILDNQISKALPLKGYQAHLVTFQVNLQPKGRNLPYDAYINLTLMPGSWAKAIAVSDKVAASAGELSPIIVYPLVISDAMETSSSGRSIEVIRQAAISLSGIVSNAGLNAGFSGGSDKLDSILGSDRNSLVTVGRVSDHSLRIRIGAQLQGSRQLALVPRTQNISVVVFTRAENLPDQHLDKLAVITETQFVDIDSTTGNPLPSQRGGSLGRDSLARRVESILKSYGLEPNPKCSKDEDLPLDLLRSLDRGDYSYLSECLLAQGLAKDKQNIEEPKRTFGKISPAPSAVVSQVSGNKVTLSALVGVKNASLPEPSASIVPVEEARLRRVVASLMTLQTDSRYGKLMIPLQPFKKRTPVPPPLAQLVFLNDDKSGARAVLRGGDNLDVKNLRPELTFMQNGRPVLLMPTSVDVDPSGTTVTATFPSIAANKLMSTAKNKQRGKPDLEVEPASIAIALNYAQNEDDFPEKFKSPPIYTSVRYLSQAEEPPGNPVSTSTNVLIADADGLAKITVNVGEWDAKKGGLALRVSGAEIRASAPAVAFDAKRKALPVAGESVVTLTLGNLTPTQVVQLRTIAGKEPIGNPIMLLVERSIAETK